jgi:hypothetical protein
MASEKRDWLILSLRWSNNEWFFKWYETAFSGYTTNLITAGRYSEAEAKAQEISVAGHVKAVKLEWVADFYAPVYAVRNEQKIREQIDRLSLEWEKGGAS